MNLNTIQAHYPGQRLSFASQLCTVRYLGSVEGTKGLWLGIEWDDPLAGKHGGRHQDKQYFQCRSTSDRAASFVRPSRPADPTLSFLAALRKKYVEDDTARYGKTARPIEISGKVVEEVGFEKIRIQQAMLQELKLVLLDGLCIAGLNKEPWPAYDTAEQQETLSTFSKETLKQVSEICPKITELDLSRNALERWADVIGICKALPALRTLILSGNRFRDFSAPHGMDGFAVREAFEGITELSLDNTLMTWDEIVLVTSQFPSLHNASLAANNLTGAPTRLLTPLLKKLSLASNNISSTNSISSLSDLANLEVLSLGANDFKILAPCSTSFSNIKTLDLSSNGLLRLTTLNPIQCPTSSYPALFPSLTSLRVSRNPLFTSLPTDTAHMLTLARIPLLQILNYSLISLQERTNAELFYLSQISAELEQIEEGDTQEEIEVLEEHPLHIELCRKHDFEFSRVRKKKGGPEIMGPETLGGRMLVLKARAWTTPKTGIKVTPKLEESVRTAGVDKEEEQKWVEKIFPVPKTISVYRLKSILGHAFSILPVDFRVIWETGEWDPVGSQSVSSQMNESNGLEDNMVHEDENAKWNVDSDIEAEENIDVDIGKKTQRQLDGNKPNSSRKGRWVRREVEVVEGTSSVGFWIEGKEGTMRLEKLNSPRNKTTQKASPV